MKVEKNSRGFEVIALPSYSNNPTLKRLLAQSSAVGDYEDAFHRPGTSALWVGDFHHLNRGQVAEMVVHMQQWLKTGSLNYSSSPGPIAESKSMAQLIQCSDCGVPMASEWPDHLCSQCRKEAVGLDRILDDIFPNFVKVEEHQTDPQRRMRKYYNDHTFHAVVTHIMEAHRDGLFTLTEWQDALALAMAFSAPQPIEPPGTIPEAQTPRKRAPGGQETRQELEDPERFDGMG
jgi:hypothetical protein